MKHSRTSRCAVLAIAGFLVHAEAATIGRAQGAVLIGRPLEVTVPVVLEGSGDAPPECAEAEVFYGDTKVPASNVSTELQTGARGPTVRVRSGAAINEPVVTVYLQVGCGSRFTRRLVLLAEPDPAVDVQRPAISASTSSSRTDVAEAALKAAPLNLSLSRDAQALPRATTQAAPPVPRAQRRPVAPAARQAAVPPVKRPPAAAPVRRRRCEAGRSARRASRASGTPGARPAQARRPRGCRRTQPALGRGHPAGCAAAGHRRGPARHAPVPAAQ